MNGKDSTLFEIHTPSVAVDDTGRSGQASRRVTIDRVSGRTQGSRQDREGVTRVEWCDRLQAWNAYGFDCKGWDRFGFSKDDPWLAAVMCIGCIIAVREQEKR